jgi:hypothetical protein
MHALFVHVRRDKDKQFMGQSVMKALAARWLDTGRMFGVRLLTAKCQVTLALTN